MYINRLYISDHCTDLSDSLEQGRLGSEVPPGPCAVSGRGPRADSGPLSVHNERAMWKKRYRWPPENELGGNKPKSKMAGNGSNDSEDSDQSEEYLVSLLYPLK